MNVYLIGPYWIAAKSAEHALSVYAEETCDFEDLTIGEPEEGETENVTISIRKLTRKQIKSPDMYCCDNGPCSFCEGSDEPAMISLQALIDKRKESEFPCVIAREE